MAHTGEGHDFWEHALFVLLIPLSLILPIAAFRFVAKAIPSDCLSWISGDRVVHTVFARFRFNRSAEFISGGPAPKPGIARGVVIGPDFELTRVVAVTSDGGAALGVSDGAGPVEGINCSAQQVIPVAARRGSGVKPHS